MSENYQSVTRRVIAILFCLSGAGVLTYLSLIGNEPALAALISIVALITGFYFGTKSSGL